MMCPECSSSDVELVSESEVRDDGQGYCWTDTSGWVCNDCKCEFDKVEATEVTYEITKKGTPNEDS